MLTISIARVAVERSNGQTVQVSDFPNQLQGPTALLALLLA
jgi:hypothetical protein